MEKDQRERLDRLLANREEVECLLRRKEELEAEIESTTDQSVRLPIQKELLDILDKVIEAEEKVTPADFVSMFLLLMLESIEGIFDAKGSIPLDPKSVPLHNEIAILQASITDVALKILEKPTISSINDGQFSTLLFIMMEIGKRLPILSSTIGGDIGIGQILRLSSFRDIQDILHKSKAAKCAKIKWQTEQAKKEKDQISYDEAGMLADKLWDEGDRSLDWQMARYISRMDGFKHLDERRIRRALEPYAVKHGRCSGFRGGKKPKK